MEELTIEQKAKCFNEAINVAKSKIKNDKNHVLYEEDIIDIFPELKELNDEKIRGAIIHFISHTTTVPKGIIGKETMISWLEKQVTPQLRTGIEWVNTIDDACDKRYSEEYAEGEYCHEQSFKWGFQEGVDWLEKQGEQKPTDKIQIGKEYKCIASPRYTMFMSGKIYKPEDKFLCSLMNFCSDCFEPIEDIEPKFKDGDWIVYKDAVWKVCNIALESCYELLKTNNEVSTRLIEDVNESAHIWTIADAKDGDVLATESWLYIFKYTNNKNIIQFHSNCPIDGNPTEWSFSFDDSYLDIYTDANIHPATKEQHDILFQKMNEAGYIWNAEKKELEPPYKCEVLPHSKKGLIYG